MTTLELKETPQSCSECRLIYYRKGGLLTCCYLNDVGNENTRHPDCPLEITEDNLRWRKDTRTSLDGEILEYWVCPECKFVHYYYDDYKVYNFCPSCGTKLLPPLDK